MPPSFDGVLRPKDNSVEYLFDLVQPTKRELLLLVLDGLTHFESQEKIKARVEAAFPELREINSEIAMEVKTIDSKYPVEIVNIPTTRIKDVLAILRIHKLIPQGFYESMLQEDRCSVLVYDGTKEK